MPEFSFTEAAFEGFRFTRERPGAVAAWAAATFGFNLTSGILGGLVGGDAIRAFRALGGHPTLGDIVAAFPPAAAPLLVTFLVNFAGASIIYASAMRSFIGVDPSVRFRLGKDEIRLFAILIIYFLIYIIVNIVVGIVLGLIENIGTAFGDFLPLLINWIAPVVLIGAPGFVVVRLLLTPVIAIDRKRIDFIESWNSTRGHFWPLAASLAISLVLFAIVAFLALMLVMILAKLISIGSGGYIATPGQVFAADKAQLSLSAIIFGALSSAVFIGVLLPVVLGPQVRAYQAYDAPDPVGKPAKA